MKNRTLVLTAALVMLGLISSSIAGALSFTPISRTFAPAGRGTTQSFRLTNDGEENIAVQLEMLTREVDENGKEHNEPADELFTVYPSQIVLRPGTTQTVKVQWKGPGNIDTERCYRILVEQLPVDFGGESGEGGNLKILFKYLGSIYITPEEAEPDVQARVTDIEEEGDEGDKSENGEDLEDRALLLIENRGSRHAILADLELTLTNSEGSVLTFSEEELKEVADNNILPGGKRRISLPVPEDFSGGDIDAALSYDKSR